MDRNLMVVLGMALAYVFGFLGMIFAWMSYRRRKAEAGRKRDE